MSKGLYQLTALVPLLISLMISACSFGEEDVLDVSRGLPVPGAVIWLRADRGVIKDGANFVNYWKDQSGNKNHAVVDDFVGPSRPLWADYVIGSKPGLLFSGSQFLNAGPVLELTFEKGVSVFAVVMNTENAGAVTRRVFAKGSAAQTIQLIRLFSSNDFSFLTDVFNADSFGVSVNQQVILSGINIPSMANEIYVNGLYNSSSGPPNIINPFPDDLYIGCREGPGDYFIGYISEIIIYNRALGHNDRRNIERYLGSKYSIPVPD
jgi:hypothetical protein